MVMAIIKCFSTHQIKFLKHLYKNPMLCFVNVEVWLNGSTCTALACEAGRRAATGTVKFPWAE